MVTLVALAALLPSSGSGAQGSLPTWTNTLGLKEDATPVDKRLNAVSNIRMRPAAVSLKVLLAEVVDYRIFSAALGSKVPMAFRTGVTPQRDMQSGATLYRRDTAARSRTSEYWASRSGAAISMSDAYTDTRARIRADYERDLRHLKRRLGWPTGVNRNDSRATLTVFWRWSDKTTVTLGLDARETSTMRLRLHLGR